MRWRLLIEEFGVEFNSVKGCNNVVADALSRLNIASSSADVFPNTHNDWLLADLYAADKSDIVFPISFVNILKHQQEDKSLRQDASTNSNYHFKSFRGGGKPLSLICYKGKIAVPSSLQNQLVTWYHTQLCHLGETRTEQTIRQHSWFHKLRDLVHTICSKCATCQSCKVSHKKYGYLPIEQAESDPWERLCVDLIGHTP
jgi:hypothetical protein